MIADRGPGALTVIVRGRELIVAAALRSGREPAIDFLDGLPVKERLRMLRVFEKKARGERLSKEDFRKLEDGLFEFKDGDRRMIAFASREGWVLTHGFVKRSAKTPRREIERAQMIRREHEA